ICEDQGGTWYGAGGAAGPTGLPSCCAVNDFLSDNGQAAVDILPDSQKAIRNEFFKLVRMERLNCSSGQIDSADEFYRVNEATPLPLLDNASLNLLTLPAMSPEQQQNYAALSTEMQNLLGSRVACPGDGNLDLIVDNTDVDDWK